MLSSKSTDGRRRFARGQKFTLSNAGAEAQAAYRAAVAEARSSGRPALEAALAAWAAPRKLAPADGVILAELSGKRVGFAALCESLESSGVAPDEVRASVGRLLDAGIVELVPLASQVGA